MIISGVNATRFCASETFRHEDYKLYGLRDIWAIDKAWRDATTKIERGAMFLDKWIPTAIKFIHYEENELDLEVLVKLPPKVTKEEREHYLAMQDRYVAEMILTEHGWEEFVKFCELTPRIKDLPKEHRPCEYWDGQCNLLCPAVPNCDIEELYE